MQLPLASPVPRHVGRTRRRNGLAHTASAALILLAMRATAEAQTAQIAGRVTDVMAAPIAAITVTVTRLETATRREVITNADGFYSAPFLPPGSYSVAVRVGPASAVRSPIGLSVGQTALVDIVVEPERLTAYVQVQPMAPLLELSQPSLGHVIEARVIPSLPLNGRNYAHLALLAPGAVANPGTRARADGINLNGGRTFENSFLIDGVDNNNYLFGSGGTGSTQAIRPSLDAIQEVRVERASYSPEFGHAGGGIFSVVTRSGANAFHGSAFEFFRHEALEATEFFAKQAGYSSPPLRYHQFGASAGGPIVRDRAFFFASYEGSRERRTYTSTITVPAPDLVHGRFGDVPIYDPLNVVDGIRQPFPDNTIPPDRIDPVGQRLAALYPAPNRPGRVDNFVGPVRRSDHRHQVDVRLDYHAKGGTHVFVRYSRGAGRVEHGSLFGPPGNGHPALAALGERQQLPLINATTASSFALGHTHVVGRALVSELRAGATRNAADQRTPATRPLFEEFAIAGIPTLPGLNGLPLFDVTELGMLGDRTALPFTPQVSLTQVSERVSWLVGAHTLKFGAEIRSRRNVTNSALQARGEFVFNGQFTSRIPGRGSGSALADLLLGLTSSAQLSTPLRGEFRDRLYAAYINDDWKVSPALTLNLGLRYQFQTPVWERRDRMANFDLDPESATAGTLIPARAGSLRTRSFTSPDVNNVAPRLGVVWRVARGSALRGAYGVFYGGLGYQEARLTGAANLPHFVRVAFRSPADAANSSLVLARGFPEGVLDPSTARNPDAFAAPPHLPSATVHQWSLDFQQQIASETVLSVAYVGSRSSHLRAFNNANAPVPGPGALNSRRRFPLYGEVFQVGDFGEASYHALQVRAERRYRSGLSLTTAYTWAHAIDSFTDPSDTAALLVPQDPSDIDAERASASIDVRHRFVASFTYALPSWRSDGHRPATRVLRALMGGWKLAGIGVAQTGFPITPTLSTNPARTTTPIRPDCLREASLPRGQRSAARWFDVSAFAPPAPFTFGNCGRNILRAPGFVNLDLVIARELVVRGDKRLELRADIFNATNRVHLGRPNAVIDVPDQAGRITSTQAPGRQVQVAVRFQF